MNNGVLEQFVILFQFPLFYVDLEQGIVTNIYI